MKPADKSVATGYSWHIFLNAFNPLMISYLLLPEEEEDDRLPPELLERELPLEPELLTDEPLLR